MRDSPIGSPASRERNPKPVAIRRTARLCCVFRTSHHTTKATSPTMRTCHTMARTRSSDHESRKGRFGGARRLRGSIVVCDMRRAVPVRRSAGATPAPAGVSRQRIGGAYWSPPGVVQSAFGPRWMPMGWRLRAKTSP